MARNVVSNPTPIEKIKLLVEKMKHESFEKRVYVQTVEAWTNPRRKGYPNIVLFQKIATQLETMSKSEVTSRP